MSSAIAKRLAPGDPEIRYNLALALARAKRPREAAAEQAEFRRLSALDQSKRSGGASDVKNSPRNSTAPGEIGPDQLQSPPAQRPASVNCVNIYEVAFESRRTLKLSAPL